MKLDRMAAFEAPRPDHMSGRTTDEVTVRRRSASGSLIFMKVHLPADMPRPDVLTHHGRYYCKRTDTLYTEAVMWPVFEELDVSRQ